MLQAHVRRCARAAVLEQEAHIRREGAEESKQNSD
jgi:hypothetical protein